MRIEDIKKYKPKHMSVPMFTLYTDEALVADAHAGTEMLFDIESYENYFLVAFKNFRSGLVITFELSETDDYKVQPDYNKLTWITQNFTLVGFTSRIYDIPMLWAFLHGLTTEELHNISNAIILSDIKLKEITKRYGFKINPCDHIDISEPATGPRIGLKMYGARMHVPRLRTLPYDPQQVLTRKEIIDLKMYCIDDLDLTGFLYHKIQAEIELRKDISRQYDTDTRSKSDAQIAEAVIGREIKEITGSYPSRPTSLGGAYKFYYQVPEYLKFNSEHVAKFVHELAQEPLVLNEQGKANIADKFKAVIRINGTKYKFGIGGLHSMEEKIAHTSCDEYIVIDRDVASYYPNIILNQKLAPEHLGESFLAVYEEIVRRRLKAKAEGRKTESNGLKITINGAFGKFGSRWSILYSPDLLAQVTITGQLTLLMLIDMLEGAGFNVVSANTDGIVTVVKRELYPQFVQVVKIWEKETGFVTEEEFYEALFSRDVNNYLAVKFDGTTKGKGIFTKEAGSPPSTIGKNPVAEVCLDAVIKFVTTGYPIEGTIYSCNDFTKFLVVRQVRGGATKDGYPIGSIVRWYYRQADFSPIRYAGSGDTVQTSQGGCPVHELPDRCPPDIDYNWYIKHAIGMLNDCGFYHQPPKQLDLFDFSANVQSK